MMLMDLTNRRHASVLGVGNNLRNLLYRVFFFFQAEDGIRDLTVTGVQTCALPIFGREGRGRQELRVRGVQRQERLGVLPGLPAEREGDQVYHPDARQLGGCPFPVWGSEEGRVGEEGRSRWAADHLKKKK